MIWVGLAGMSCTTAKKKLDPEAANTGNPLAGVLTVAKPISEDTIASLQAIADSASSQLPPGLAENEPGEDIPGEEDAALGEFPQESGAAVRAEDTGSMAHADPAGWIRPGLNPDEVNPGDLFFDQQGPVLRKSFSLLDGLPAGDRGDLLKQFTRASTRRVPVTVSRKELVELTATAGPGTELPTRSVALDLQTTTYEVDAGQFLVLLDRISKGDSAGTFESAATLARLKKQLEGTKQRLRAGETVHLVTSVAESASIRATYPGAPVGKRDAEPIRNVITALYPHLRNLEAVKIEDSIGISGNPRLTWEFTTREIRLEGDRFVLGPGSQAEP